MDDGRVGKKKAFNRKNSLSCTGKGRGREGWALGSAKRRGGSSNIKRKGRRLCSEKI